MSALIPNDRRELKPVATKSCDLSLRLLALQVNTNYKLTQTNGQRCYGPPPNWSRPVPGRHCEIYIGKLPRDAYEDEIVPLLSKAGPIYEMRLMMDFSGFNRGFAFVRYFEPKYAKDAVKLFHGYEVRPNEHICVYKSIDNRRLYVCGLPCDKSREEIRSTLASYVSGIMDIILYRDPRDRTKNRGYAFVEFESHRHAMQARKIMWPSRLVVWGSQLVADWAIPVLPVDHLSKVRVLYVGNLNPRTTNEILISNIIITVEENSVVNVKKYMGFAFVTFKTRNLAENARRKLQGLILDGHTLTINWAHVNKPQRNHFRNDTMQIVNGCQPRTLQRTSASTPLSAITSSSFSMISDYDNDSMPVHNCFRENCYCYYSTSTNNDFMCQHVDMFTSMNQMVTWGTPQTPQTCRRHLPCNVNIATAAHQQSTAFDSMGFYNYSYTLF